MTKEEKIQQLSDLLLIPGNTSKLVRSLILQAAIKLEDEAPIDQVLALLQAE